MPFQIHLLFHFSSHNDHFTLPFRNRNGGKNCTKLAALPAQEFIQFYISLFLFFMLFLPHTQNDTFLQLRELAKNIVSHEA